MPLVRCPDCERRISDQAVSCIHCGRPISLELSGKPTKAPSRNRKLDRAAAFSAVLVVSIGALALLNENLPGTLRPQATRRTVFPPSTEAGGLPTHEVAKREIIDQPTHGKAKLSVTVDGNVTDAQLRTLLETLHRQAMARTWKCNCEPGVWIWVYTDAAAPDEAPDQWVAMLADSPIGNPEITFSDERTKPAVPAEARAGREIIGHWKYISGGTHWVTSLYQENGSLKEELSFSDGTRIVRTVFKSQHPKGMKYMDPGDQHGEFVVLQRDGTLGLYSPDGQWGTAKPIKR